MKTRNKIGFSMFVLIGIFLVVFMMDFNSAAYLRSGSQYTSPGFSSGLYGIGGYGQLQCGEVGQDFLVQVAPLGCSPAVVRSDLLADQNTPVYCQLAATKVNPLIDVKAIEYVSFSGPYPEGVSDIAFHPAKAALGFDSGRLNSPVLDNIGYAVVVLKQHKDERTLPDFIEGNMTARLRYDIENAFGIGRGTFYLPVLSDSEWKNKKSQYGFWRGRGYLRAEGVDNKGATVSIYDDFRRLSSVSLRERETSDTIYMPGFDCLAGLDLRLDGLENPRTRARLNINGDIIEAGQAEEFLENKCRVVREPEKYGLFEKVSLSCSSDVKRGETIELINSPKIEIEINGEADNYSIGDNLSFSDGEKNVFFGFVGIEGDVNDDTGLYLRLVKIPKSFNRKNLSAKELSDVAAFDKNEKNSQVFISSLNWVNQYSRYVVKGSEISEVLRYGEKKNIYGKEIEIKGFAEAQNVNLNRSKEGVAENYAKAKNDYNQIILNYLSDEEREIALFNLIKLSYDLDQRRTVKDLCSDFKRDYPESKLMNDLNAFCTGEKLSNSGISTQEISIKGAVKRISFEGVYEPDKEDFSATLRIDNGDPMVLRKNQVYYFDEEAREVFTGFDFNRDVEDVRNVVREKFGEQCSQYADYVVDAARKYEIDPLLLFSIMKNESQCDASAEGKNKDSSGNIVSRDIGLMQINTKAHCGEIRDGKKLPNNENDCVNELKTDTRRNIFVGASILNKSYWDSKNGQKFEGCSKTITYSGWKAGLRGYNGWRCYPGQDDYVENIIGTFNLLGGSLEAGFRVVAGEFIQLKDLEKNHATFSVNVQGQRGDVDVNLGEFKFIGKDNKYRISLTDIDLIKLAKVSVLPRVNNAGTEINFPFKIGIEKRAIQLTPEQTTKKIEDLNNKIEAWKGHVENLGNVVKGLNTACLGVGGFLTLQNVLSGGDGRTIARKKVMTEDGGWNDICSNAVSKGEIFGREVDYSSVNDCFFGESDNIDKDVEEAMKDLDSNNKYFRSFQDLDGITKKGFLGQRIVDDKKLKEELLKGNFIEDLGEEISECFSTVDINNQPVAVSEILKGLNTDRVTVIEIRDLKYNAGLCNSDREVLANLASKNLERDLKRIHGNTESSVLVGSIVNQFEGTKFEGIDISYEFDKDAVDRRYNLLTVKKDDIKNNIDNFFENDTEYPIKILAYKGGEYLLVLDSGDKVKYGVKKAFNFDGLENGKFKISKIADEGIEDELLKQFSYTVYDKSSYENRGYKDPILRYFENEPYKGQPAIVPFDLTDGWYVSIKQSLPFGGNIQSYQDSGRPMTINVCNVWENVKEENRGGDDKCTQIIFEVAGQPHAQISGLSKQDADHVVNTAVNAIEAAQRARLNTPGVRSVTIIDLKGNRQNIEVGEPAVDTPDIQCTNIYSPSECKLLFNVCDPVVCPSSRCNLGGKYQVADVIQSGIIGSLALCLPNANEGIYVPICLSGVHAGADSWVKVQENYRDCLQTSLDTGEQRGICDEVNSFYTCDFFWRQGLPFAKLAVPKALEFVTGQNVQGGGEYLGVKDAWESAGESASYFTNYYAKNSFDAFKARSVDDVGVEACKAYVSGTFPAGGDFIDRLTEPVSPPSYHGRFEEIPHTTATNPPASQYKVSFFISAGQDSQVYYQVYLKGAPETSFYQDTAYRRIVASGLLPRGESVAETPDFLAPSGYKQLCFSINGQEKCGFKQVSTEFAVNYVNDLYMQEQVSKRDIEKSGECVAGSASAYSLISPNVQGAAEEIVNPAIYNRGIVRICASGNPGQGSDEFYNNPNRSRWIPVGKCEDISPNMQCWLDRESVKRVIEHKGIEGEVLESHAQAQLKRLRNEEGYLTPEEFLNNLSDIKKEKGLKKKILLVTEILDKAFLNSEKAKLFLLRGDAYGLLAVGDYEREKALSKVSTIYSDEDIQKIIDKLVNEKGYDEINLKDLPELELSKIYEEEFGESYAPSQTETPSEPETPEIETSEVPSSVDDYVSPVFEFQDGTNNPNYFYRFRNGIWEWTGDKERVDLWANASSFLWRILEDKDREFTSKLEGKSYDEGLLLLMKRTSDNNEGGWFYNPDLVTEFVEMDNEGVFKVRGLYFKFNNVGNKFWSWSPDKKTYMPIPKVDFKLAAQDTDPNSPWNKFVDNKLIPENIDLINSLEEANTNLEGARIIFEVDTPGEFGVSNVEGTENIPKS